MKIVKRGRPKTEMSWQGTCSDCGSVIKAQTNELAVEWDTQERGSFGRANCPVCGHGMVFYPDSKTEQGI